MDKEKSCNNCKHYGFYKLLLRLLTNHLRGDMACLGCIRIWRNDKYERKGL